MPNRALSSIRAGYLVGDSLLTDTVLEVVERLQPDVIVCPAGAANMGIGGDILFSVDELVALAKVSRGQIFANHLEALDHCPTTRASLRQRLVEEGLQGRVHVPEDGESISFASSGPPQAKPREPTKPERPGPYKWITAPFGGT